ERRGARPRFSAVEPWIWDPRRVRFPTARRWSSMAVGVGRIRDASGRLVSAPVRAVRSGMEGVTATAGERLESEVERAADVVLAGRFPEALARSLVERRVAERVVAQMVESGELDRMLSAAVNADATERLVREIGASPIIGRLLT